MARGGGGGGGGGGGEGTAAARTWRRGQTRASDARVARTRSDADGARGRTTNANPAGFFATQTLNVGPKRFTSLSSSSWATCDGAGANAAGASAPHRVHAEPAGRGCQSTDAARNPEAQSTSTRHKDRNLQKQGGGATYLPLRQQCFCASAGIAAPPRRAALSCHKFPCSPVPIFSETRQESARHVQYTTWAARITNVHERYQYKGCVQR